MKHLVEENASPGNNKIIHPPEENKNICLKKINHLDEEDGSTGRDKFRTHASSGWSTSRLLCEF